MAVVYKHINRKNNKVFYVGIGKTKKRAYSCENRNKHWHNIVNKYGYDVEFFIEGISFNEAKSIEITLIKEYGRIDIGSGQLVNMTDGGDGRLNSEAWNKGKSFLSGKMNPMYGIRRSDEWKKNHSENAMKVNSRGEKHHKSIIVLNTITGIFYESAKAACDSTKYSYSYFKQMLNGCRSNKTNFIYV
jgi:hypothetical protein